MSSLNVTISSISLEIIELEYILRLVVGIFGLIILIFGLLGNLLNIIIFISLNSYKENACSLYILCRSIFDILILIFGLGTRILSETFQIDLTSENNIWCKLRVPIIYINTLNSYTFLCLQSIDAYFVTSLTSSLRQISNIRRARYFIIIFFFFWTFEEIPYLFFQELVKNSVGNSGTCLTINSIYGKYRTYFIYLFLTTIVPIILIILFDILTYRNLHIHLIEKQNRLLSILTRQMTKMTLFNLGALILFQTPFAIAQCYFLTVGISKQPIQGVQEQIIQQFFNILGYGIYAVRRTIFFQFKISN